LAALVKQQLHHYLIIELMAQQVIVLQHLAAAVAVAVAAVQIFAADHQWAAI
jgi:hypothetical protein